MRKKQVILAIAAAAAVLCLAAIAVYSATHPKVSWDVKSRRGSLWEKAIADIVSKGKIVYEPPEYDFKLDEMTVEIAVSQGILEQPEKEYTIAFVNDLHLITDDKAGDVLKEHLPTVKQRRDTMSTVPEGIYSEKLWPEVVKFLNYRAFDAVIFAGDMLDYGSRSNMKTLAEGLDQLKYPKEKMMYLRSDHDYGGWYGGGVFTDDDGFKAQSAILGGDREEPWIAFEEFTIVGVNRSYQNLSEDKLRFLMGKLQEDKPVIVASHVPFYSKVDPSLEKKSMEVRNRIYYWNEEDSSYRPDENTQKFIDCMYDKDSNVRQILAAHLHAAWDGQVTDKIREHIFAPVYEGRIGVIHVKIVNDKQETVNRK